MSDNHAEVKNQVVISVEDCKNVREYGKHFGVDISDALNKALDAFIADQTFENQNAVKLQMCKWMLTNPHPSFKDKLWEEPQKLAEEATFNLQFDEDVKEALTRDEEAVANVNKAVSDSIRKNENNDPILTQAVEEHDAENEGNDLTLESVKKEVKSAS